MFVAACSLLASVPAMAETTFSGQSETYLRLGKTDLEGSKNFFPLYEYLRLSTTSTEKDGSTTSLHIGGWGRVDLGDKSARDRYNDADLQYGFLSYQGAKNNLVINAGRQFVVEGVATERIDGLYAHSDIAAGFGAAAFVGQPVVTEPNVKAGDFIFGGRVTHSNYKYYTIGVSALRSTASSASYREEEGVDLWLHPVKQVDVTGRSSYNSLTDGWMEHAYAISYTPVDSLRLSADLSNINYRDYFYRTTTNAFSVFSPTNPSGLIDPREKLLAIGGSIAYTPVSNFTITGDFKNYHYDIARSANYYGAKVGLTFPEFAAGLAVHKMDGETNRLKYNEIRLFASKKIGHLDLAVDLINVHYLSAINGINNAYTVVGAALYEISESLKVGADVDYSKNPDFDNEVKGLVKVIYAFDTKHAAEGRSK